MVRRTPAQLEARLAAGPFIPIIFSTLLRGEELEEGDREAAAPPLVRALDRGGEAPDRTFLTRAGRADTSFQTC